MTEYFFIWLLSTIAAMILGPSLLREVTSSGWKFWPPAIVMFTFCILALWAIYKILESGL